MSLPSLKIKTQVIFPSLVEGGGGITVSKSNGTWTIEPDFSALATVAVVEDPAAKQIWIYDPPTGIYNVMTLSALGESLFIATSESSVAIGLGTKTFTIQEGKLFTVGSSVIVTDDAAPTTNYLFGVVTGYSGETLDLDVSAIGGSGTKAAWTITISGAQGATGSGLTQIMESIKTAAYTVQTSDVGKRIVLNSASAATFTLPPAATAGSGFAFWCRSINTGVLTVDGDGSETIDGDASFVLEKDEDVLLTSTGTGWRKVVNRGEGHQEPETDVASAATCDVGATNTEAVRVTGATTITSLGPRTRRRRRLRFTGNLTLTHNATSLILPGGANITTAANDIAIVESDASGNWRVISYTKAASGPARETLNAARTYYVATTGSDSANTGLTVGSPFATIQKAYDTIVSTLDTGGFAVTIQIADSGSNYGAISVSKGWTGGGPITVQGNSSVPSNVVINPTGANAIEVTTVLPNTLTVKDLKLQTTTSGDAIRHSGRGQISFQNVDFGAVSSSNYHVRADVPGAHIKATGNYTISGGAGVHAAAVSSGSTVELNNITITLTGTPNFASIFAYAVHAGLTYISSTGFSGSATGTRYLAQLNGMIVTNGATLPGNAAGSTATGGQYT